MTPFVTSWTQKWPKMNQKSPKTPEILIKWLCWSQNAYRWVFLGWKTDCGVKIMTFWLFEGGKTILWRQIWRQISWNSQKCHSNDVRMPTNDRIELKTCMDTYFHQRNAMVVSKYLHFDLMKANTILWHQIWRQIS